MDFSAKCVLTACVMVMKPVSMSIQYTGALDAVCPITLALVCDLTHPVVIISSPSQPYELAPLWKWVLSSGRHPLTGEACSLSDIAALKLPWRESGGRDTEAVVEGMRLTIGDTQVLFFRFFI